MDEFLTQAGVTNNSTQVKDLLQKQGLDFNLLPTLADTLKGEPKLLESWNISWGDSIRINKLFNNLTQTRKGNYSPLVKYRGFIIKVICKYN